MQERGASAFSDWTDDTRALIEDTTQSIREICAELHPRMPSHGALFSMLKDYAGPYARRTGLQTDVTSDQEDGQFSAELELALFRVAQEALTNSAKHAYATHVQVDLQFHTEPMVLSIIDNGVGFDVGGSAPAQPRRGQGLVNMRETAEFNGCDFESQSTRGGGTQVTVRIPKSRRIINA